MPVLLLAPVLGIALLYVAVRREAIAVAPLLACGVLVTALYLVGLVGLLGVGAFVLFWGGALALLPAGWLLHRQGILITTLTAPPLIVFVGLTILHWMLFHDAEYFKWDEFSHWGLAVREMLGSDALYGPGGNVYFLNYPPGMPLWLYFGSVNAGYSEANTYVYQFVLLVAALLPLLDRLSWKDWPQVVASVAMMLFLLGVLGHGWASLYVDHVVGAVFLGVMLVLLGDRERGAWRSFAAGFARGSGRRDGGVASAERGGPSAHASHVPQDDVGRVGEVLPLLLMLALVKDVGLYFAICAGLFWVVRSVVLDGVRWRRVAVLAVVLLATPVLTTSSWSWRQSLVGVTSEERVLDVGEAIGSVFSGGEDDRSGVANKFARVFFSQETGSSEMMVRYNEFSWALMDRYGDNLRPSSFAWIVLAGLLFGLAWWQQPDQRRTIATVGAFMVSITLVYFAMLLCLYLFVFTEAAADRIRSYIRYANIALLPLWGMAFAVFLTGFGRPLPRWVWMPIVIAAMSYVISPPYVKAFVSKPWTQEVREQMAPLVAHIQAETGRGDSVYIHVPEDQAFLRMMVVHDLTPIRVAVDRSVHDSPDDRARLQEQLRGHAFAWFTMIDPAQGNLILPFIPEAARHSQMGGLFRVESDQDRVRLYPIVVEQD